MKKIQSLLMCDFYKTSHRAQYPEKTEIVYETWTPRMSRIPGIKKVSVFGIQGFIKEHIIEGFNENFFDKPLQEVIEDYQRIMKNCVGPDAADCQHIIDLHNLGYLPIEINALDEGMSVDIRVPMMTIENTHPDFFWLPGFFETFMSLEIWKPMTSMTLANEYKRILSEYAIETTGSDDFVKFQGHDFSMRGMGSYSTACTTGAGHLAAGFAGTDTIPAILYLEQYYGADVEKELVGCSIPATEHSVMCAGGVENEFETNRRLIEDVYPNGMISIVMDSWDLFGALENIIKPLKDSIMKRDGKVVIRPDSGDPADIVCGTKDQKGVIEILWEIFGGTVTEQGFKVLDPHIGCIYGDAITLERCNDICKRLKEKGFASTNMVFGIGSFTYQYVTRDTFGFALKSTSVTIDGVEKQIFKDPKTDSGMKKSQKGRVAVYDNGTKFIDGLSKSEVGENLLTLVFKDGNLFKDLTLSQIRKNGEKSCQTKE